MRKQAIINRQVREFVAAPITTVIKIRILMYFATPRKLSFALITYPFKTSTSLLNVASELSDQAPTFYVQLLNFPLPKLSDFPLSFFFFVIGSPISNTRCMTLLY